MRLSFCHLLVSLLCGATAAENPRIHYADENWSNHGRDAAQNAIDPSAARLLIAHRLGLSRFHSFKGVDESVIQDVNRIGSLVLPPLAHDSRSRMQILVVVEGLERTEDVFESSKESFNFELLSSPSPETNLQLLEDFARQAIYLEQNNVASPQDRSSYGKTLDTALLKIKGLKNVQSALHAGIFLLHIGTLETIARSAGTKSSEYRTTVISIRETMESLRKMIIDEDVSTTIALFPLEKSTGSFFKRKSSSQYGLYSVPNLASPAPRQVDDQVNNADSQFNTATTQILTSFTQLGYSAAETASLSSPSTSTYYYASSTSTQIMSPPTGILPACFSSKQNCESATNSCSGHGSCQVKYTYKERESEISCFACSCEAEKRSVADGGMKTTLWAGPACQKKDVSMEFWLLAGFTVFFVGIISWGMGMLYTMGQQDLPSVIGAGVSGPRAK